MRVAPAEATGPDFFGATEARMSPDKLRFRRGGSRMAKKKRSAALFEVMVKQEQRRLPRPPGMFRTLVLWFKNRPKAAPAPAVTSVLSREDSSERVITEVPLAPVLREADYLPPPEPMPVREEPRATPMTVHRQGGWLALR